MNSGLSSKIIADVSFSIKKYTFSGARIERVAVNLGAEGSSVRNFKDDASISRSIATMSVAQSI